MDTEHTPELQQLYLEMFLASPEVFVRCQNIFNPKDFNKVIKPTAEFILEFAEKYQTLPTVDQIMAKTGLKLNPPEGLSEEHYEWLVDEFEVFAKRHALERAILESYQLLEKGEYAPIEDKIKAAIQTGLT